MCGATLNISEGSTIIECEYCGSIQTLPKLDGDKKANMYDRANHFRRNSEFDKAMGIYEQILNEDPTDSESYWSLVLCRYGIEYVEDPSTKKRIPTVNRAQFTSIFDDINYKSALEYADSLQKSVYESEAKTINEIQKEILAISEKEEPFDVFICYKETDENGRRTQDSVLATDLYYQLTNEGFKVFFARITLEDKLGSSYEPYIFAASNSAKVMVVLGTKPEYFNAVWVKNEWSRYLSLVKSGAKKMLIPAYRDMDPYDLPEEFSHLQAQDMSKLGFMQDLIRGIKKIIQVDETKATVVKETVIQSTSVNTAPLLKRAFMFLEDGDWKSANEYCEKVLDIDPECGEAYLGKLMAELKVGKQDNLKDCAEPFECNNNYKKAVLFCDETLKSKLVDCKDYVEKKIILEKKKHKESILKKREELSIVSHLICAEYGVALGLKSDGTVNICGLNEWGRYEVMNWSNIISLFATRRSTIGLRADGSVFGWGENSYGQCFVGSWRDIVDLAVCDDHTVGLKSDGTVVACGNNFFGQCNVGSWRNVKAISLGSVAGSAHTVGLKSDGTVVACGDNSYGQCNVGDWINIVDIFAYAHYTMGLKSDGTVVACGDNSYGQCNVSGWKDIIAISTEFTHAVGLKSDGTVVACGENSYGQCNVGGWKDVYNIYTDYSHTIGLKTDGTLVVCGENTYNQNGVSGWTDIVAISSSSDHIVGLKYDGTVVATGVNHSGSLAVGNWKLFGRIDKINEERLLAQERERIRYRKSQNLCQHCGGSFKGLFNKKCSKCDRPKDY